jgi:hypothetical protein
MDPQRNPSLVWSEYYVSTGRRSTASRTAPSVAVWRPYVFFTLSQTQSYCMFRRRWFWSLPNSHIAVLAFFILTCIAMIIGILVVFFTSPKSQGMFSTLLNFTEVSANSTSINKEKRKSNLSIIVLNRELRI